jgi:ATP phosphoribosyltransferase
MNNSRIKIAIQKKGRLKEPTIGFLNSLGIEVRLNGNELIKISEDGDYEFIFVRDDDIPQYVAQGAADFGIVGLNVYEEKNSKLNILQRLSFGNCRLVIAVKNTSQIRTISDLQGERIATSYPKILTRFLKKNNINASIIEISGSVESAPDLNLADAVCDITQSGSTLKEHDLKITAEIMDSQAILIESPFISNKKKDFINLLINNS